MTIISNFLPLLIFIWGAALGSFLNVVILRSMRDASLGGRSQCPGCHKPLRWYELVPILSFTLLRGRCARCRHKISVQYPLIELSLGLLALILLTPLPLTALGLAAVLLKVTIAALLLVLFVIDLYTMYLPDRFVWPLLGVVIAHVATEQAAASALLNTSTLIAPLTGAAVGAGLLGALWLITRGRGIGLGDVKLMLPLGLLFGPAATLVLLFLAFVAGGALGLILIASQRASLKTAVPFGPFLIGAAFLLLIYPALTDRVIHLILG